jgi:hypothetical protein
MEMEDSIIRIRDIDGVKIFDALNCAYISERFFNRSRSWIAQRLNNNVVNGKPVSFTADELFKLRTALKVLASEITHFTTQIPKIPTDMSIEVYVVTDRTAIDYIEDGDIDGFKEYLAEEETLYFEEPETFDSEAEALAFCAGIGFGMDERAPAERFPLKTSEPLDLPFIEAIKAM